MPKASGKCGYEQRGSSLTAEVRLLQKCQSLQHKQLQAWIVTGKQPPVGMNDDRFFPPNKRLSVLKLEYAGTYRGRTKKVILLRTVKVVMSVVEIGLVSANINGRFTSARFTAGVAACVLREAARDSNRLGKPISRADSSSGSAWVDTHRHKDRDLSGCWVHGEGTWAQNSGST